MTHNCKGCGKILEDTGGEYCTHACAEASCSKCKNCEKLKADISELTYQDGLTKNLIEIMEEKIKSMKFKLKYTEDALRKHIEGLMFLHNEDLGPDGSTGDTLAEIAARRIKRLELENSNLKILVQEKPV